MAETSFSDALKRALQTRMEQYPRLQAADIVKFVFQGFLGVGHLLNKPDLIESRIADEMQREPAVREEPLTESLGPAWCRLSLRRAKAEGLTPRMILNMMRLSGSPAGFTREDVIRFCRALAGE